MTTRQLLITAKHPFVSATSSADIERREARLRVVKAALTKLTPAGTKVLRAVMTGLELRFDLKEGYSVLTSTNRDAIAAHLGRPRYLYPHDITLLNRLAESQLITVQKRALPERFVIGTTGEKLRVGPGFEYRYSISSETLYCMLWIIPREQIKLSGLAASASSADPTPTPPPLATIELPRLVTQRTTTSRPVSARPIPKPEPKRGWWDKLTGRNHED